MHDDKTIHLTNAGLEMAASVVRRMLTELLLARVLGCPGRECTKRPIAWNTAFIGHATRVAELIDDAELCLRQPAPWPRARGRAVVPLLDCQPQGVYALARA